MFASLLFGIAYIAGIKGLGNQEPRGVGVGVLQNFLGLKFSIPGFFG